MHDLHGAAETNVNSKSDRIRVTADGQFEEIQVYLVSEVVEIIEIVVARSGVIVIKAVIPIKHPAKIDSAQADG